MLKNHFDPTLPLKYVIYARMSTDRQNPRSPEQQEATIRETIERMGHPWQYLKTYRDDGISGRYTKKRPAFMEMRSDIRSGRIRPDVILVDTAERFGRSDDTNQIRRELFTQCGIRVLTADSHFVDPQSVPGTALAFVEGLRSTEENRIKAHNVERGKRDAIRHKVWPGGPVPFGFRLEATIREGANGRQEIDYSRIVPEPAAAGVIRLLFQTANEMNWGMARLAKFLNSHPDVPAALKPLRAENVGYWLGSPLYRGDYVWGRVSTGVIDDRRICQANPESEHLIVEDYCEAIVPKDLWEAVQVKRKLRSRQYSAKKRAAKKSPGNLPVARGLVLKYPLTGLVRCGHCGRSMIPASSREYQSVRGDRRRYVGYVCPAAVGGTCENKTRVPEDWLRKVVVAKVLDYLQLGEECTSAEMLEQLIALIEREIQRVERERPSRAPALQAEFKELGRQIQGWAKSLARPELPDAIRRDLEERWSAADSRKREIELELDEELREQVRQRLVVDPEDVIKRLQSLHEVLAGDNATEANLQLALHIDAIESYSGGRVELRICKLGLQPALVASIVDLVAEKPVRKLDQHKRRRGRLATDSVIGEAFDSDDAMYFAMDPDRFAGLPDAYFWTDTFQVPKRQCWAELHAVAVYARRGDGLTFQALAKEFGASVPTIRKAYRIGKQLTDRGEAA